MNTLPALELWQNRNGFRTLFFIPVRKLNGQELYGCQFGVVATVRTELFVDIVPVAADRLKCYAGYDFVGEATDYEKAHQLLSTRLQSLTIV